MVEMEEWDLMDGWVGLGHKGHVLGCKGLLVFYKHTTTSDIGQYLHCFFRWGQDILQFSYFFIYMFELLKTNR